MGKKNIEANVGIPILGLWDSFKKEFKIVGDKELKLVDSDGVPFYLGVNNQFEKLWHGEPCTLFIYDMGGKNHTGKHPFNQNVPENHEFANHACIYIKNTQGKKIFEYFPKENDF